MRPRRCYMSNARYVMLMRVCYKRVHIRRNSYWRRYCPYRGYCCRHANVCAASASHVAAIYAIRQRALPARDAGFTPACLLPPPVACFRFMRATPASHYVMARRAAAAAADIMPFFRHSRFSFRCSIRHCAADMPAAPCYIHTLRSPSTVILMLLHAALMPRRHMLRRCVSVMFYQHANAAMPLMPRACFMICYFSAFDIAYRLLMPPSNASFTVVMSNRPPMPPSATPPRKQHGAYDSATPSSTHAYALSSRARHIDAKCCIRY